MNKHTTPYTLLNEAMMNKHSKRMNAIMHTCDDAEFAVLFFKLLEYVKPKMQRVENASEQNNNTLTIVHEYSEKKSI